MSTFFVDGLGYHHLVFPSPPICALCPPILWPLSRWAMANTWNSHQLPSKWKWEKDKNNTQTQKSNIWNPHQTAQYWFSEYFHDVHRLLSECVVSLVGLVGLFGLSGFASLVGCVGSWGSGWGGGPDGSGGSGRPSWLVKRGVSWGCSGSCWSCGSCGSGAFGESAWLRGGVKKLFFFYFY